MYILAVAERIDSTTVSKQRTRCLNAIFVRYQPAAIARLLVEDIDVYCAYTAIGGIARKYLGNSKL